MAFLFRTGALALVVGGLVACGSGGRIADPHHGGSGEEEADASDDGPTDTQSGSQGRNDAGSSGTGAQSDAGGGSSGSRDGGTIDAGTGARDGGSSTGTDAGAARDAGGTRTDAAPPPVVVNDCNGLAAAGTWEEITPAAVKQNPNDNGVQRFGLDPLNPGVVYLGTDANGVWKSSDCGATWKRISTGRNAQAVNSGRHWCLGVDQEDSKNIYVCNGYGSVSLGLLKSKNGGVDWDEVFPANKTPGDKQFDGVPDHVGGMVMDPTNAKHILLDFHEPCEGTHPTYCIGETYDGGETWKIIDADPRMVSGHDSELNFLGDSKTWLVGTLNDGIWRSTDSGAHWTRLGDNNAAGQIYHAKDGTWYLGGKDGVLRSSNGIDWAYPTSGTGQYVFGIIGTGKRLYAASYALCFEYGAGLKPYFSSAEDNGKQWTAMQSPGIGQGGQMLYDPAHKLLYSSNCAGGFWRVVAE